jgi:hypothetical protein
MLKAASNLCFYMFFLALGELRPYSARRAWLVRIVRAGTVEVSILRRRKEIDGKTT